MSLTKKSLIALAVTASLPVIAQAQTSVILEGIFKSGLAFSNFSKTAAALPGQYGSQTALQDGSSQFHIRGSEDLGGGVRAIFQVDNRFRIDDNSTTGTTASQFATGNTYVGLAGGFGQVRLGKMDIHYVQGADEWAARSGSLAIWNVAIIHYVGPTAIAGGTRTNNLIRYDSPSFGGLTITAGYSTAPTTTDGGAAANATNGLGVAQKGYAATLAANYANGPLQAGISYWYQKNEGNGSGIVGAPVNGAGQTGLTVNGGYNLGFLNIGAVFDQSKLVAGGVGGADRKRNAWSIPLTAPIGAGTVLLSYSQAQGFSDIGNSGAKLATVGYDYPLSKRTSIGASYGWLHNNANAGYTMFASTLSSLPNSLVGQTSKQLLLGVRHAF